jgi:hypothetical protein
VILQRKATTFVASQGRIFCLNFDVLRRTGTVYAWIMAALGGGMKPEA